MYRVLKYNSDEAFKALIRKRYIKIFRPTRGGRLADEAGRSPTEGYRGGDMAGRTVICRGETGGPRSVA